MPTPLTEIEIENRKKVLLEHLAKTGQKVPKAFMGLNMQTIYDSPGIQQAIAEELEETELEELVELKEMDLEQKIQLMLGIN